MKEHNKITLAKEYCLCRRIPYRMKGEQLWIGTKAEGYSVIFSVYNLPYSELIACIDRMVNYDLSTTYYISLADKKLLKL